MLIATVGPLQRRHSIVLGPVANHHLTLESAREHEGQDDNRCVGFHQVANLGQHRFVVFQAGPVDVGFDERDFFEVFGGVFGDLFVGAVVDPVPLPQALRSWRATVGP